MPIPQLISLAAGSAPQPYPSDIRPTDAEALDAYSTVVTTVAERLAPSVASLRVGRTDRRGRQAVGSGSAVVISPDGYLLTSAHVVAGGAGGKHKQVYAVPLELED